MKTPHYYKEQDGFTLLELMVVFVIIGILYSIAIPAYQAFTSKTQIHSAFQELSTLKVPLDLYHNEVTTDAAEVGWLPGMSTLIQTPPVLAFDSSTNKYSIEATIDGNAYPAAVGVKIKLLQRLQGGWTCIITKSSSMAWKNSLAPKECQVIE